MFLLLDNSKNLCIGEWFYIIPQVFSVQYDNSTWMEDASWSINIKISHTSSGKYVLQNVIAMFLQVYKFGQLASLRTHISIQHIYLTWKLYLLCQCFKHPVENIKYKLKTTSATFTLWEIDMNELDSGIYIFIIYYIKKISQLLYLVPFLFTILWNQYNVSIFIK